MKISTSTSRLSSLLFLIVTGVLALQRAAAVDALLLQDTYVDSTKNAAGDNFGVAGDLKVSKSTNASSRAFLRFSIDTLPPGTTAADIKQARLRLWVNNSSTTLGSVTLSPVTSSWSEVTLTNNTSGAIALGLPKHADLPVSLVGQFVSIDLTDWVQAWLTGTLTNQGFEIEPSAASQLLNLYFDSKESTQTSHEPRLEITLVGPAGPQGPQGIQGLTGGVGPAGAVGPQGPQGSVGPTGVQGPAGAPGFTGATGPVGPQGPRSAAVLTGAELPPSDQATGANGDIYINTDKGNIYGPKAAGSWGNAIGSLYGIDGTSWYSGVGAPTSTDGKKYGDYYLQADTGDVYRILGEDGAWSRLMSLRGAAGDTGAKGDKGDAGEAGPQGLTGVQGSAGPIGPAGPQGPKGDAGVQGTAGPEGPAGSWPARLAPQGDLSMGEFTNGPTP